jgi:hypothetical protein
MTKIKPGQLFHFGSSDNYYIRLLLKDDPKFYLDLVICLYSGKFGDYNITITKNQKNAGEMFTKLEPEVEKEFWKFLDKEFLIMSLFSRSLDWGEFRR